MNHTMPRFKALIAKCGRPEWMIDVSVYSQWQLALKDEDSLERDAILRHCIIARLPYQRHIASIGSLESPRKKSRHCIPTHYAHIH